MTLIWAENYSGVTNIMIHHLEQVRPLTFEAIANMVGHKHDQQCPQFFSSQNMHTQQKGNPRSCDVARALWAATNDIARAENVLRKWGGSNLWHVDGRCGSVA